MQATACIAALKQWGLCYQLYAADYDLKQVSVEILEMVMLDSQFPGKKLHFLRSLRNFAVILLQRPLTNKL